MRAVSTIQPRYRASGVIPVRPPQPVVRFGPVDQLTTPSTAGVAPEMRNAGAPESPPQAPKPALSPLLTGSYNRICSGPPAGDHKRGDARGAAGAAITAHRHAVTGNHKRIPGGNGFAACGDDRWRNSCREWLGKFDQCNIGGRQVVEQSLDVKLRMTFDVDDVLEHRRLPRLAAEDLVIGAGLHAMRGRQQKVAVDRRRCARRAR